MNEGNFFKKQPDKLLLIDNLDLSARLYQFLKIHLGISSLDELSDKTEKEIKETPGCTAPNFKELNRWLKEKNITLKQEEIEIKNGWVDNTEKYKRDIRNFILLAKSRNYNHLTEFHLSGMNSEVLKKIYNGFVLPEKIEVLYENNGPKQVHVSYNGEKTGQFLDFYISGKVLEDFFSGELTIY